MDLMRRPFFRPVIESIQSMLPSTRPLAVQATPLVGWFLLTQGVTVVALALFVLAAWAVCAPLGLVVCGVCLIVLERKVEIDRRSARET